MKITLRSGDFGSYLLVGENGQNRFIQTDWDFPGIASTFGWSPCSCGATDGTVACVHKSAGQMIAEAQVFLGEHIGEDVADPGYFE